MTPLNAARARVASYIAVWDRPEGSYLELCIDDLRTLLAALDEQEWQPIETAPRGAVTEQVGIRAESEWFSALVVRTASVVTVRRCTWPQGDYWQGQDGTIYSTAYFDLWRPLPAPPVEKDNG